MHDTTRISLVFMGPPSEPAVMHVHTATQKKVLFIDILFSFVIRVFLYSCEGVNLTSLC